MSQGKTDLLHLGIDIGSISVNTVVMNNNKKIIENRYDYCQGRPYNVLFKVLQELMKTYRDKPFATVAFTGSGGQKAAELLGGDFVNEIIAQSTSVAELYPHVKTVIEMGGEDSKLILMDKKEGVSRSQLDDFAMNSLCAAGTGSFLDQQAKRIGVPIKEKFGALSLQSENPPRIAGRCSVFAKSDMIHLQQIATPLHDIVAGLCFAVARNFKSNLGRGKTFEKPIMFQGGVAANAGVVRAFTEVLELKDGELEIPDYHASMGAIGALMNAFERSQENNPFKGLTYLKQYLENMTNESVSLEPLVESKAKYQKDLVQNFPKDGSKLPVYLGLDIGSLSTNVVLIDDDNNVVARRYLPTASKPLDAFQRGLREIQAEVGDKVEVVAAGTTGSGRYLTGDFIGADSIQNEITAQATAAIAYDPTVDTIFEIGGQDSKYIRIKDGVVVDFEMNKVCAAGTGSFLEEQAEKLGINIKEEFGERALSSKAPVKMGERCTVFMESDLNSHQQRGESTENMVGGLAYSIVQNYINRVVGDRIIGDKIFFQGGVTHNKAVVAAFEKVTGKPITIPPHFDVTGAIGAAMLARESLKPGQKTRFKGFDVSEKKFTLDKFTCEACSNQCEIQRVSIEGENKHLFFGGRCDKFEVDERKGKGAGIPNLFKERTKMLLNGYKPELTKRSKITVGIPRALMIFYQQFPFWRTFFEELDFNVVLSKETDMQLSKKSLELMASETCYPVEVMHGHVNDLLEKEVDYVFIPFIVDAKAEKDNPTSNCNCPWIQSYPFMMRAAFQKQEVRDKFLIPTLHFRYFGRVLNKEIGDFFKQKFGIPKAKTKKAIQKADEMQVLFETQVKNRGREVMANLPEDKESMVVLGRPYNTGDPALNLRLIEKLINLDVQPIPIDFLPLEEENIFDDYPMMYWPNGQKILKAARIVKKHPQLNAVYLGNFRCGPDSFLNHFVTKEMGEKPFLHLEVDEHSADAGLITRCEAFLDSLKGYHQIKEKAPVTEKIERQHSNDRVLYYPYMRDSAYVIAAASRSCGMKAEVLPMQNERDLELARKHTSGNECFPLICTTGSFLKKLEEPGVDPSKVSFFMPDHNGPCRFGEYNKLQRQIFDKLGYHDVEILAPSNEDAYAEISKGQANKFRFTAWKGFVAVDMLRKMQQERRPYEAVQGYTNKVYNKHLQAIVASCENGAKDIVQRMEEAAQEFASIPIHNGYRKPVIAIVGEIFMRDNAFCSGFLVDRLEALGAETVMAPMSEWLTYSTYRYKRDSLRKGDIVGVFKSKIQKYSQDISAHKIHKAVEGVAELNRDISLNDMLASCSNYVHKDYDGDPPLSLGAASKMVDGEISGIVAILPFTCMPGTLIASVSQLFRKDHGNIPWENIAYDGQEDSNIETRLQAFMHQASEFSKIKGYNKPRHWAEGAQVLKEHIDKINEYTNQ
ncbi:MAG: acyl-CoA dehydratase activase [Salinivirgaceae bacterium]